MGWDRMRLTPTGGDIAQEAREGIEAPLWKVGLVLGDCLVDIRLSHAHLAHHLVDDHVV